MRIFSFIIIMICLVSCNKKDYEIGKECTSESKIACDKFYDNVIKCVDGTWELYIDCDSSGLTCIDEDEDGLPVEAYCG